MYSSKKKNYYTILLLALFFSLSSCDNRETINYWPEYGEVSTEKEIRYVIGIHPLHNPQRLHAIFGPLADLLTEKIDNAFFEIEASRNYAAFDEKLYSGKFEFALPNPYQTIRSLKHGYQIFGKMGDDDNFRGIILVRKDSKIYKVADLKGKTISFPAPTALAATMMPQYYLHEHGIDVNQDIKINYVGSQESSIMNVFLGDAAAGTTWPPPWKALSKERPQLLDELEIKWKTKPLPNNGFVVRNDIPLDIVDKVSAILFDLHKTKAGQTLLEPMELSQFEPASNQTYQPVNQFLKKFNDHVRKIEY